MHISFAASHPEDEDWFWQLHQSSYREVILEQFGGWSDAEQHAAFLAKWRQGGFRRVMVEGRLAGAIWLQESATEVRLAEIQLHPSVQKRGVGTAILRRLIAHAHAQGKPLRLSVLFRNPARALYERLGFRVTGQSAYQYHMEIAPPQAPTSTDATRA